MMEEKTKQALLAAGLIIPKEEVIEDIEISFEREGDEFIVPKEELSDYGTTFEENNQYTVVPKEELSNSGTEEDNEELTVPKKKLSHSGITFGKDDQDSIVPKEELSNSSHQDGENEESDTQIETKMTLSKERGEIRSEKESERGESAGYIEIKVEPADDTSSAADCEPSCKNDVGSSGAWATSPLPQGSEKIPRELSDVWEEVFGSMDGTAGDSSSLQPALSDKIPVFATDKTSSGGTNNSSGDECGAPPKKKVKKRLRRTSEWSDVKRKFLKNIGKKYVTKKGKVIDDKILQPPCHCKYKCFEKISHDERCEVFKKFWCLGSRELQWAFVVTYTRKQRKNRSLKREGPNNRQFTFKYFLPLINSNQSHSETVNVCKTMFLNTLSVSGKIIKTAWDKYDGRAIVEEDRRGRHANHNKVIKPDMIKSVCDHVRSFIPVQSHYVSKTSKKIYLDGSLSIPRMFQLYKDWFDDAVYSSKALTERQYRDIVKKNFNLGFFVPK